MHQDPYLFVVGTGRTGSKIYTHIVNSSPRFHLSRELKFKRLLQPDVLGLWTANGSPTGGRSAEDFVEALLAGDVQGDFWQALDGEGRKLFEEGLLEKFERANAIEAPDLLHWFLDLDAQLHGKEVGGAKFPVHLKYADELRDWFPRSLVLHLTRDPRAATSSHMEAQLSRVRDLSPLPVPGPVGRTALLGHKIYEYHLAADLHRQNEGEDWYELVRFEDLVRSPRETIEGLCDFVGMEFQEEMLKPPMVASSYEDGERGVGFDESALTRWREHLPSSHRWLIEVSTGSAARVLGYSL